MPTKIQNYVTLCYISQILIALSGNLQGLLNKVQFFGNQSTSKELRSTIGTQKYYFDYPQSTVVLTYNYILKMSQK
jgi:hypothetical protein